jgi:hypothetical protein
MVVDRLIHHQPALAKGEHGPIPIFVLLLDAEAELFVKLDAGWHAPHGQHRDETVHFHRDSPAALTRDGASSAVGAEAIWNGLYSD